MAAIAGKNIVQLFAEVPRRVKDGKNLRANTSPPKSVVVATDFGRTPSDFDKKT